MPKLSAAAGYVCFKAMAVGAVAYGVIGNNGFSELTRALIVAGVSGILGIIAVAVGALINSHTLKEIQRLQYETKDKVSEIANQQPTEQWDKVTERRQSTRTIRTDPDRMAD